MPDVIRHPCFDSALPGYAQHKRPHVHPERSGAKSKGLSGGGEAWIPACAGMTGGTDWLYGTAVSVVAEGHEDPQDVPEQQRYPGKQGQ